MIGLVSTISVLGFSLRRAIVHNLQKLQSVAKAWLGGKDDGSTMARLLAAIPVAVFRYEEDSQGGRRFTYVSPSIAELCGIQAEEVVQNPYLFFDLLHRSDYEDLSARFSHEPLVRQQVKCDLRLTTPSGESLWLRMDAKPEQPFNHPTRPAHTDSVAWCGCLMDVSAERLSHHQTDSAQARFEKARSVMPIGLWEYESTHKKLMLDAYSLKIFDIPAEEFNGDRDLIWEHRCHPEDKQSMARAFREAFRTGRVNSRFRVVHRDGSLHWVRTTGVCSPHADGGVILAGIHWDVTPDMLAAHALTAEKENSDTSQISKAMFLASMSHEIRSPMNGILGMLFLLSDSKLTERQAQWVEDAKISAQNLLVIINDILDFSKLEAGKLLVSTVKFSPAQILENILSLFRHQARSKGIKLNFNSEINNQLYLGDPIRFHQVASNIIGNAVKFTSVGQVSVVLKSSPVEYGSSDFAVLRVEVTDTGIGIDKDYQALLFEPFSQGNSSIARLYGGTGLGLAICKQLVDLMGGRMGVISEVGRGSTFWFELVLEKATDRESGSWPQQQSDTLDHELFEGLRVLVADDSVINQKLITAFLSDTRCQLTHVQNGQEAVDAVVSDDYDIVLMDMQMPVMDGITAIQEIRKLPPPKSDVYIIGVTAGDTHRDGGCAFRAGVADCMSKPVNQHTLLTCIAEAAKKLTKKSSQQTVELTA